jgi:hypothetical protein
MAFISDLLLTAGAFGVAIYCMVLSKRLRQFANIKGEIGQTIERLSSQIEELDSSLKKTQEVGRDSVKYLSKERTRAENAARHLELLVASLHSLPTAEANVHAQNPFLVRRTLQSAATP